MNKTGNLYLIPSAIGEGSNHRLIPPYNLDIIGKLKYFIAEEIKTARRFLKKALPDIDFNAVTFLVYNEHYAGNDLSEFIEPLLNGQDTGLLSEAGTPCVADPGSEIVSLAHQRGIRVIPLTGPSSLLLALMASGFNGQNFAFHGYLPIDKSMRVKKIREIEKSIYSNDQTQIFIETPYRNFQLYQTLTETCSEYTRLCIATDLTMESERIITKAIKNWKGDKPDIHKRPTVFLLYK